MFPPTKHDLNQYVQHGPGARLKTFLAHQVIEYEEKWRKGKENQKNISPFYFPDLIVKSQWEQTKSGGFISNR